MKEYHTIETLYNAVLTPDLNTNIIRSLPIELRISFNDKYFVFINLDADNNSPSPAVLKFLKQYVENLNNSYKSNPMLLNVGLSPMTIGMKQSDMKFPRSKKEICTCLPGKTGTEPADPALSVPSKFSNQTIILSAGTVGSRNFVLRKLSKS